MLQLYYSKDQGLLDNVACSFKNSYKDVKHIKNPSSSELELALIQTNLDGDIENLIIEHYKGSLDVLDTLIQHSGVENVLILLSYPPKGDILDSVDNSDLEIKSLNETTKKGYITRVIKERYTSLKIPKELLKEIKERIPPCALTINELVENLNSLYKSKNLNEITVRSLLKNFKKDFNFFNFLKTYLDSDFKKWVYFFGESVVCAESLKHFVYSLSYQLLEFKSYLSIKKRFSDSEKIASIMKSPKYVVSSYRKLCEHYNSELDIWLNNFIIDLYIFHFSVIYSPLVNITLLRHFLFKKKLELQNKHVG